MLNVLKRAGSSYDRRPRNWDRVNVEVAGRRRVTIEVRQEDRVKNESQI